MRTPRARLLGMIQRGIGAMRGTPAGNGWRAFAYAYFAEVSEGRARS